MYYLTVRWYDDGKWYKIGGGTRTFRITNLMRQVNSQNGFPARRVILYLDKPEDGNFCNNNPMP